MVIAVKEHLKFKLKLGKAEEERQKEHVLFYKKLLNTKPIETVEQIILKKNYSTFKISYMIL